MIEFYPQIKAVHIAMVLASGLLFSLRGAGVLAGMQWPMRLPVKLLSYTIDTTLLTAALMLFTILPHALFSNGWLTAKLVGRPVVVMNYPRSSAAVPGARARSPTSRRSACSASSSPSPARTTRWACSSCCRADA